MPAPAPEFGTVIHLETGHVLAAVTGAGLAPDVAKLVGTDGLRVRFPDSSLFVNVPADALKVTRVAVTADVLDRPQHYALLNGIPALGAGPDLNNGTIAPGTEGRKAVVVWWVLTPDPHAEFVSAPLDAGGGRPGDPPGGAVIQLFAYEGGRLYINTPVP